MIPEDDSELEKILSELDLSPADLLAEIKKIDVTLPFELEIPATIEILYDSGFCGSSLPDYLKFTLNQQVLHEERLSEHVAHANQNVCEHNMKYVSPEFVYETLSNPVDRMKTWFLSLPQRAYLLTQGTTPRRELLERLELGHDLFYTCLTSSTIATKGSDFFEYLAESASQDKATLDLLDKAGSSARRIANLYSMLQRQTDRLLDYDEAVVRARYPRDHALFKDQLAVRKTFLV